MTATTESAPALAWLSGAPDWLHELAQAAPPSWHWLTPSDSATLQRALQARWSPQPPGQTSFGLVPELVERCRERLAQAVPLARLAEAVASPDGEATILLWDRARPEKLWVSLGEAGAPVLWLPAGTSVDSVAGALAPYHGVRPVEERDEAVELRAIVGMRSELRAAAWPLEERFLRSPWLRGPLATAEPALVPTLWFRAIRSQSLLALEAHDDRVALTLRYVPTGQPEVARAVGIGGAQAAALTELPVELLGALLEVAARGGELWSRPGLEAQIERTEAALAAQPDLPMQPPAPPLWASPLGLAEAALTLDPLWHAAHLLRAEALLRSGQAAAGLVQALVGMALARRRGVRLAEALARVRALRAALSEEPAPEAAEALLGPIQVLLWHERGHEAREVADALLVDARALAPLWRLVQALGAGLTGRPERAVEALIPAIEELPNFAAAWRLLAVALEATADLDGAGAALGHALRLAETPDEESPLERAGQLLLQTVPDGRLSGDARALRFWLAQLHADAQRPDEALRILDALAAAAPDDAAAHLARGVLLTTTGRGGLALAALDRAEALLCREPDPAPPGQSFQPDAEALGRTLYHRAVARALLDDASGAQQELERAIAVDPDWAEEAQADPRLAPILAARGGG